MGGDSLSAHLSLLIPNAGAGLGERRAVKGAGDVSRAAATGGTMESDPATLGVFGTGPFGHSLDSYRATRRTDQRFLVPIRRDQNQCFRCSVLLNAPTSHGRPFQWGTWHGSGYPTLARNLPVIERSRKGLTAFSSSIRSP